MSLENPSSNLHVAFSCWLNQAHSDMLQSTQEAHIHFYQKEW